ncbi:MAG: VOC family protein [Anaerolineales bacterium]|nr:VOC family protein [Anaerolineales bacterium]
MAANEEALIKKVDCIRLAVSDLEAGMKFYRDALGQRLIWRSAEAAGLGMPGSETEIVLYCGKDEPEIDLLVDAAEKAAERFRQAGGAILVQPFEIQIGKAVVVQDPWGNRLVLLDTSKGLLVTDEEGNILSQD